MSDFDGEEIREHLETAMLAARTEMLRMYVAELMIVLARENFRLDDLLQTLAEYCERRPDWSEVSSHLVQAANAVQEAKEALTGSKYDARPSNPKTRKRNSGKD
jgi:hypothetical protein